MEQAKIKDFSCSILLVRPFVFLFFGAINCYSDVQCNNGVILVSSLVGALRAQVYLLYINFLYLILPHLMSIYTFIAHIYCSYLQTCIVHGTSLPKEEQQILSYLALVTLKFLMLLDI